MIQYLCEAALLPDGIHCDVVIDVQEDGTIADVVEIDWESSTERKQSWLSVEGLVLPGMNNLHSHAFQWGFAGLAEYRATSHDNFWTWRQRMFDYLVNLTPQEMHRVAREVYGQMAHAGYRGVGEFHYLHTDPNGRAYDDLAEMSNAVIQAAVDAGIEICLLPAVYQRGGFDDSPLSGGQRRFFFTNEQLWSLLESLEQRWSNHPQVHFGLALHSLRAVDIDRARELVEAFKRRWPLRPIHIHVAEQKLEVEACQAVYGCRPIELLLDRVDVDPTWCVIHATHMSDEECRRLAASGAVVGLCPTTEANLGDGVFLGELYNQAEGSWGIGSDSQIAIDIAAELRMLEYSQRLTSSKRAILCSDSLSCGEFLYLRAAEGGGQALGIKSGKICRGYRGDFVTLSPIAAGHQKTTEGLRSRQFWREQLDRFVFLQYPHWQTNQRLRSF